MWRGVVYHMHRPDRTVVYRTSHAPSADTAPRMAVSPDFAALLSEWAAGNGASDDAATAAPLGHADDGAPMRTEIELIRDASGHPIATLPSFVAFGDWTRTEMAALRAFGSIERHAPVTSSSSRARGRPRALSS